MDRLWMCFLIYLEASAASTPPLSNYNTGLNWKQISEGREVVEVFQDLKEKLVRDVRDFMF